MDRQHVQRPVTLLITLGVMWSLGVARGYAQATPATSPTSFINQQISLDLKGVDILDVLKLLSQKSGLNFVAGRNVSGRVTIFAKDVDVWDAFERIVAANDLAYEVDGQLVNVMTARDYELLYGEKFQERKRSGVITLKYAKAAQLATVLNQLKSNLGRVVIDEATNTVILNDVPVRLKDMEEVITKLDRPTDTRIYSLNYAEAEKLKEKVQDFLTPGIGVFSFDARTNKVVVTDLQENLNRIDKIITALDEREGEVLIDAKIVKVVLTDQHNLGIDWQQVFGGIDISTRSNLRVLSDIVGGTATGGALKLSWGPRNNTILVLEALKKYGTVETISNPRIRASNNQEAKILVGTKEAFVTTTTTVPATGATVSSPQIQFIDVGTKLFVTPKIKRDGHIQLKIRPEVSSATVEEFGDNRIPIVSTTEAETNVLVQSGSTLIIGGLIESVVTKNRSQIPGLGNLPVVGAIFGNRSDNGTKTELVVFLTPQIVSASGKDITDFADALTIQSVVEVKDLSVDLPESYRALLRERLNIKLFEMLRASKGPAGSMVLSFMLNRRGQVVGQPDITSPAGEAFIRAGKAALDTASPFPPFPDGTNAEQMRFRIAIDYRPTS